MILHFNQLLHYTGSALGLLLVFRTNTAYNRFWEGRKIWEKILNSLRDLGRMTVAYGDVIQEERVERVLHLLCAFPLGMYVFMYAFYFILILLISFIFFLSFFYFLKLFNFYFFNSIIFLHFFFYLYDYIYISYIFLLFLFVSCIPHLHAAPSTSLLFFIKNIPHYFKLIIPFLLAHSFLFYLFFVFLSFLINYLISFLMNSLSYVASNTLFFFYIIRHLSLLTSTFQYFPPLLSSLFSSFFLSYVSTARARTRLQRSNYFIKFTSSGRNLRSRRHNKQTIIYY